MFEVGLIEAPFNVESGLGVSHVVFLVKADAIIVHVLGLGEVF